jgi:hypothetical protein
MRELSAVATGAGRLAADPGGGRNACDSVRLNIFLPNKANFS